MKSVDSLFYIYNLYSYPKHFSSRVSTVRQLNLLKYIVNLAQFEKRQNEYNITLLCMSCFQANVFYSALKWYMFPNIIYIY
jgi:hypothetical protein